MVNAHARFFQTSPMNETWLKENLAPLNGKLVASPPFLPPQDIQPSDEPLAKKTE